MTDRQMLNVATSNATVWSQPGATRSAWWVVPVPWQRGRTGPDCSTVVHGQLVSNTLRNRTTTAPLTTCLTASLWWRWISRFLLDFLCASVQLTQPLGTSRGMFLTLLVICSVKHWRKQKWKSKAVYKLINAVHGKSANGLTKKSRATSNRRAVPI